MHAGLVLSKVNVCTLSVVSTLSPYHACMLCSKSIAVMCNSIMLLRFPPAICQVSVTCHNLDHDKQMENVLHTCTNLSVSLKSSVTNTDVASWHFFTSSILRTVVIFLQTFIYLWINDSLLLYNLIIQHV